NRSRSPSVPGSTSTIVRAGTDHGCDTLRCSAVTVRTGVTTMPGSHWMIVMSPENFEISRERGFDVVGLKSRHRKKAERMALGDRVLFYVAGRQVFPLTATVSSTFFEDHSPIWVSTERRPDAAPWRVQVRSDTVLQWYEYLDARQIAPRMLYVKRWAPEDWPLAFQGQIHLLSSQDFAMIEHEMRRVIERRG